MEGALEELRRALSLSEELQDFSLDADIWGEMADTYADLGNYEQAAQVPPPSPPPRASDAVSV